jgi:hypothetical protein
VGENNLPGAAEQGRDGGGGAGEPAVARGEAVPGDGEISS